MECKTPANLDLSNLVPRGPDYIEGIARFEARNYLVMIIAPWSAQLHTTPSYGAWPLCRYPGRGPGLMGQVIQDIATVAPRK